MIGNIWLGDKNSYVMFMEKQKLADNPEWLASMRVVYEQGRSERPEKSYESRLLSRQGSTALLTVAGSLTNSNKWYNEYTGAVAYEEIQEALTEAGEDESVDQIVMAYSTGGGTASGIKSAGDYIKHVNKNVKPIYAFTDTAAFSAGYWLYSAAGKGYVESMAQLGSVGAIQAHVSYKEMLASEGITYTIFRAGSHKALGHPSEELTDEAKAEIQLHLEKTNDFFLSEVIENRGVLLSNQSTWGEGKTHFGSEAISVGLADEISTLHALLGSFTQQSGNGRSQYGGNMPKEITLKTEKKAPELTTPVALTADEIALKQEAADNALAELNPELTKELTEAQLAELEAEASLSEGKSPEEQDLSGIDLKGVELLAKDTELAGVQATLLEAQGTIISLEAQITASLDTTERLKTIVLGAANTKLIAMGGTAMDMSFLDVSMTLQHFEKVQEKFTATFKAGRASAQPDQTKPPADTLANMTVPSAMERSIAKSKTK